MRREPILLLTLSPCPLVPLSIRSSAQPIPHQRRMNAMVIVARRDPMGDFFHDRMGVVHRHRYAGVFEHAYVVWRVADREDVLARDAVVVGHFFERDGLAYP